MPPTSRVPRSSPGPRPTPSPCRALAARAAALAIVAAVSGPALAATPEEDVSPRALVIDATNRLMDALAAQGEVIRRDPALAHRLAQRTVFPLLDFARLGRRVLGKHWRRASPAQRRAFMQEFRDYAADFLVTAMTAYSERIVAYSDRLSYPAMPWSPGDTRTTVRMRVRLNTGIAADIDYRMRLVEEGWRIHDITFEGVSLVLAHRDAFAADINAHGLDGVIDRMSQRNHANRCARSTC